MTTETANTMTTETANTMTTTETANTMTTTAALLSQYESTVLLPARVSAERAKAALVAALEAWILRQPINESLLPAGTLDRLADLRACGLDVDHRKSEGGVDEFRIDELDAAELVAIDACRLYRRARLRFEAVSKRDS